MYPYCHPDPAKSGGARMFVLGNDPYLGETSRSVRIESDPTDSYSYYGFKFFVRKVPTIPVGGNSGLYEYVIEVFRVPGRGPLQASGRATAGNRYSLDTPPGIVSTIPMKTNGDYAIPYWRLTARISGP